MMKTIRSYLRISFGLARAILLLAALALAVLILSVRATTARADDAMMDLGRHLIALSEAGLGKDTRGVLLNGQEIGFRVFTVDQKLETTLDFYEAWCHGEVSDFSVQEGVLRSLDQSSRPNHEQSRSWKDLTIRSVDGDMGYIGCLKHGIANASADELDDRLVAFAKSGNLSELGQFHYATVTQFEGTSRVVVVWTEGEFYPMRMFPAEGDAPGFDPTFMSRPPSGRRTLSAGEIGEDETLTIYIDCEEDIKTLADFYRLDLILHGWRVLSDESTDEGGHLLVVQLGNEMRAVALSQQPGETASVTIASTR